MKLVLFADLHLDAPFAWAGPEPARRRRQALRDALRSILALADEVGAEALLCAGDLYEHDRFTPDTREFLRSTFSDTHRSVFVAPGNHDWLGPQSLYTQVPWPGNVTIFQESRLTPLELAAGITLWGAAHRAPANTDGFLDRGFSVDRDGIHLALFHGSERSGFQAEGSGKEPHGPFDAAQLEAAGIHHAFVGHFHQPRDEDRYTYPGNPEPLRFGESGARGAVVVEVDSDGSVRRERRRVSQTLVHDLPIDISGCTSFEAVRSRVGSMLADLGGLARLTITGELAPAVELDLDALRELPHQLDAPPLVRAGRLSLGYDLDRIATEPTVRGRFVRDVQQAEELDDDARRRVLFTGLRALEGRDDLEVP